MVGNLPMIIAENNFYQSIIIAIIAIPIIDWTSLLLVQQRPCKPSRLHVPFNFFDL